MLSARRAFSPEEMLNKAKDRYVKWKGGPSSQQPQPQPRKDPPRVQVTVDRNARREQLPNQPTRSMAPPQIARKADTAQPSDRSSIIANMRKSRGQFVA